MDVRESGCCVEEGGQIYSAAKIDFSDVAPWTGAAVNQD